MNTSKSDHPNLVDRFLESLADPARPLLPFRTAIVVAHPDDETIACGALLPRLPTLTIVHVTDGAPRSLTDARARGFDTARAYALARRRELEAAVALAGVPTDRLVALDWPDQEASDNIAELARDFSRRLAGLEIVITHAYEGGHPDHDATALAVHAACALLGPAQAPSIVEAPLYRAGPGGRVAQSFTVAPGSAEIVLALTEGERRLKQVMFAAHASQSDVLDWFQIESERYRIAPRYDFSALPNGGDLLYESFGWGTTGVRWLALAEAAIKDLGLQDSMQPP